MKGVLSPTNSTDMASYHYTQINAPFYTLMHLNMFQVIDIEYAHFAIIWSCSEERKSGNVKSNRQFIFITREAVPDVTDSNLMKDALNLMSKLGLVRIDKLRKTRQDCTPAWSQKTRQG